MPVKPRARDRNRLARPNARKSALPKAIVLRTAGGGHSSAILEARLDQRSIEAKMEREYIAKMVEHCGGESEVNAVVRQVIQTGARLHLLEECAFAEIVRSGIFTADGKGVTGAFTAFMSATRRHADILVNAIGLKRWEREVSLTEFLAQHAADKNDEHQ